jgi:anti-sigma-K factor RskA
MTHVEPFDLEDWDRRLDAGGRSDPLLEIAANLRELAPQAEPPSADFKARLRARLRQQYAGQALGRRPSAWRWAGAGLAVIAAIVLALAGLSRRPERVPAVSAAEVLHMASGRLAEQLATSDVIYDRLSLDWDQGGDWRREGVLAE